MSVFKLKKAKGTIKPFRCLKATTEATGAKGRVTKVTQVQVPLELEVSGKTTLASLEILWPGIGAMIKTIKQDEDVAGADLSARKHLPEMTIDLFPDKEGSKELFHLSCAGISGKPKLKIDEDGKAIFCIQPKGKFSKPALAKLSEYIEADVWVTMEPSQVDMSETTTLAGEEPKEDKPKSKKAKGKKKKTAKKAKGKKTKAKAKPKQEELPAHPGSLSAEEFKLLTGDDSSAKVAEALGIKGADVAAYLAGTKAMPVRLSRKALKVFSERASLVVGNGNGNGSAASSGGESPKDEKDPFFGEQAAH